ncbi:MAG: CRISPR-associated endonuclease Cas1 [Candidatus Thorarchaeota archaeon]
MSIVVDEPGTRIGRSGRSLSITPPKGRTSRLSMYNVAEVIVTTNCSISSQAVELLAQNGVPLLMLRGGTPYAILHPFFHHGTVHTRREQLAAYWDDRGVRLARAFVLGSMRNRRSLLEYFARNRRESSSETARRLDRLSERIRLLESEIESSPINPGNTVDSVRTELMGIEAQAARAYFEGLAEIVPPAFGFQGREKRPPKDPINSMLSYGYAVLYSRVLTAIAACGLEPFAGFLHADRSGKPSLVLDMVEEFRQVAVDRVVIRIVMRRQVTPEDFEKTGSRVIIAERARKTFLSELITGLNSEVRHTGKRAMPLRQVMMKQARMLVRFLLRREREYRPYSFRW